MPQINPLTAKTAPVVDDVVLVEDSASSTPQYQSRSVTLANLMAGRVPSYALASAPADAAGLIAFISDGRKDSETAGNGTGVLAYNDGSDWLAVRDDSAVVA